MIKDIKEYKKFIKENKIEFADFKLIDLRGRFRHLTIPAENLTEKTMKDGIGFDASNYGYAKVEKSDMVFIPDLSTAVIDPFSLNIITMLANVYVIDKTNYPFEQYPRNVINAAVKLMKDNKIADEMLIAPEYEFNIFDSVLYNNQAGDVSYKIIDEESAITGCDELSSGYHTPVNGAYHIDGPNDVCFDLRNQMCEVMKNFGINVKYHHHEVGGTGQQEIEVELGEVAKTADQTMLTKYIIKNVAVLNDASATFMPKPIYGEAGNGMHIHMILNKGGKNIFYKEGAYGNLSDNALYFIGGILKHINAICAFANPSTNSYKRLVPGFEAPVTLGFACANRSSVIRIPGYAKKQDTRFELRNPDATCNPYYTYSAILLAGIDGIKNKIDPRNKNYGPFDLNLYDLSNKQKASLEHLPTSLEEAVAALRKDSDFLTKDGVFSKELIERWINTISKEANLVSQTPHPREFELYYDI